MHFFQFLFVVLFFSLSKADLPIHCLTKELAGQWTLFLGSNDHDSSISCSHLRPDKNTDHIFSNFKENFQISSQIKFELQLPNLVLNENNEKIGFWTAIYDEGFEIRVMNQIFFAFSKYIYAGNKTPKDEDDEQSSGYANLCNETFLGWFYSDKTYDKWGCFYGEKNFSLQTSKESIFKGQNTEKIIEKSNIFKAFQEPELKNPEEISFFERFRQKLPLYDIPHEDYIKNSLEEPLVNSEEEDFFHPDFNFIELVNDIKLNSPWKAKLHDDFLNKTHRHMKNLLGLTRFKELKLKQSLNSYLKNTENDFEEDFFDENSFSSTGFLQIRSKIKHKYENSWDESLEDMVLCDNSSNEALPRCFDWRNHNSINFDSPVQHQGECGSCYVVAALSSIESRIRIKSNNKYTPKLSVSGALACSRYNQGCNGGYPELVAKFGMDHGFYEDSCGENHNYEQCFDECFNGKLWKIKDYGYVGKGYYGGTDEKSMMKEILENGPIIVAINAAPDLYYYSSGTFISNPTKAFKQENGHPEVKAWQFTNHAVVCVGWGEVFHEGKVLKYWILKNSWGKEWGEHGYFKMLRGVNLGAVENQAIFAVPNLE